MKPSTRSLQVSFLALILASLLSAPYCNGEGSKISGALTIVSDYTFRGISQTMEEPAIQGGFDYEFENHLYLAYWASNVSGESYDQGSSEMDFVLGKRFELEDEVELDLGATFFYYSGAKTQGASSESYDTLEAYFGISWRSWNVYYRRSLNDWFGVNENNPFNLSASPNGGSDGSTYLSLGYTFPGPKNLSFSLHMGKTTVANYEDASYSDIVLKATWSLQEFDFGLAYVDSNADEDLYSSDGKDLGDSRIVASIVRSF